MFAKVLLLHLGLGNIDLYYIIFILDLIILSYTMLYYTIFILYTIYILYIYIIYIYIIKSFIYTGEYRIGVDTVFHLTPAICYIYYHIYYTIYYYKPILYLA